MPIRFSNRPSFTLLAGVLACAAARADNPAEVLELPQVQVVGTTLLPGSAVPLRSLPANAQIHTGAELLRQASDSVSDFLERNALGVTVNAAQGNPYQPDVNFRGFTASPLLGTPQGLSVFVDGVRVNEPFGDSVHWDLIAPAAISSIQLVPGSTPAFGLNTLGGAIAVYTRSGASAYPERPGGALTLSGGSFGRRTLGFEAGGRRGPWDAFVTVNDSHDDGWARHNASRVRQLFAKVGWQNDLTDLDLTLSAADNRLDGTQTLPQSFGDDVRQAYTHPDTQRNRVAALALKGSHALSPTLLLSGNAYVRQFSNRNVASNVNADAAAGDPVQAFNDAASIEQTSHGAGLQLAHSGRLAGRAHRLAVGASLDQGHARYVRQSQPAAFTADRGTRALGDFAPQTDSDSSTRHLGVFFTDTLTLGERWTLTLAGRHNRADVTIADRSGNAPELNGTHRFERFNPAVGLAFNPTPTLTVYAGYNEGMRAPTAVELTCADPNLPCRLPNQFLADPPLKKVVSKTIEVGARGRQGSATWSAAVFRTDLHDDLQFISSSGTALNAGYFQNVGVTRRQGIELAAAGRRGPAELALRYSFLDATYRTGFAQFSPNNSSADANGAIAVRSGDRLPGLPRHALKARLDLDAGAAWHLGAGALLAGAFHARGDENNLDANGRLPGHAVFNLDARFAWSPRLTFFARIDNVLDRRYPTFGVLGSNVFTGPGGSFDAASPRTEQFRGYGAPRGAWAGVRVAFE